MRARIVLMLVAVLALGTLATAPGALARDVRPCDGGQAHASPTSFWPPNHRLHTVHLAFTKGENDGDTLKIEVLSITHNEMGQEHGKMLKDNSDVRGVGNSGTGIDSAPDSPPARTTVQVRAERLGSGNGRVYSITVRCSDSGHPAEPGEEEEPPNSGTAVLHVTIPHNH